MEQGAGLDAVQAEPAATSQTCRVAAEARPLPTCPASIQYPRIALRAASAMFTRAAWPTTSSPSTSTQCALRPATLSSSCPRTRSSWPSVV